ncbi:unnamed protein product [Zymoseptoria tritici ST99CH_3D1]|nr:unnamed protein product [Zymoseptoria tritici ST99CH_3D1]
MVVHDRDRALIKSFESVFPRVPHYLCIWHMNTAVQSYADTKFGKIAIPPQPGSNDKATTARKKAFDEACIAHKAGADKDIVDPFTDERTPLTPAEKAIWLYLCNVYLVKQ